MEISSQGMGKELLPKEVEPVHKLAGGWGGRCVERGRGFHVTHVTYLYDCILS